MRAIWRSAARTSKQRPRLIRGRFKPAFLAPQIAVKLFGMFAEINLAGAAGGVDLAMRERVPAAERSRHPWCSTLAVGSRRPILQQISALEFLPGSSARPASASLSFRDRKADRSERRRDQPDWDSRVQADSPRRPARKLRARSLRPSNRIPIQNRKCRPPTASSVQADARCVRTANPIAPALYDRCSLRS